MLEVILALAGLTFLWAYLYSKSPKSTKSSGFAFRLIFLSMTLWTSYLLIWNVATINTSIEVFKFNETGNFVGKEIHNSTLSEPVKQSVIAYLDVLTWVTYAIIALIVIFFIYNAFTDILAKRKEGE